MCFANVGEHSHQEGVARLWAEKAKGFPAHTFQELRVLWTLGVAQGFHVRPSGEWTPYLVGVLIMLP